MNKTLTQSLLVGAVMFGSIVGAGFASGKEVLFYFARFGWVCIPMILFAGVLLFVLGYCFLEFGKNYEIKTVQQMNNKLFGRLGTVGEIVFIFSNIILLSAMLAGANSLFDIVISSTIYRYASVFTAIVAIFISWFDFEKMVKINLLIVPALILIIFMVLYMGIDNIFNIDIPLGFGSKNILESIIFCILYVCSNLYFAGFIYARLGNGYNKRVNCYGSLIASIFLIVCLLGIVLSIYLNPYSSMSDMPLVFIANSGSHVLGLVTLGIVWIGIATTAISLIYTLALWLSKYIHSFKISSVLIAIIGLLISGIGFGIIVSYFYSILGVIGFIFIIRLLIVEYKQKGVKKCEKLLIFNQKYQK